MNNLVIFRMDLTIEMKEYRDLYCLYMYPHEQQTK